MEVLFWSSFVLVGYVYVGYPLILLLMRRMRTRVVKKSYIEPTVTLIIAAHNERDRIAAKLKNCFQLDYPRQKLQILVSLDGPSDGTEFVVWKQAAQGVEMVHSKEHLGKAAALNRGVKRARGEIVVFADVRQMFAPSAIRELVANFADDSVGAATGELLLLDDCRAEAKTDVGVYWRYEKALRSMESAVHSVLGATGAIYAIRRELYCDIPEDTILDDVLIPMRIVVGGKRTIFEPNAKAYDEVACCSQVEYSRKVRTLAGNYQVLLRFPQLLVPFVNPVFFQFISHKVGRLVVPYALIAMFVSNLFLWNGVYAMSLAGQSALYVCALGGYLLSKRNIESIVIVPGSKKAA